jgi:hypothetical protein
MAYPMAASPHKDSFNDSSTLTEKVTKYQGNTNAVTTTTPTILTINSPYSQMSLRYTISDLPDQ